MANSKTIKLRKSLADRGIKYDSPNEYVTIVHDDVRTITFYDCGSGLSINISYRKPVLLTVKQALKITSLD